MILKQMAATVVVWYGMVQYVMVRHSLRGPSYDSEANGRKQLWYGMEWFGTLWEEHHMIAQQVGGSVKQGGGRIAENSLDTNLKLARSISNQSHSLGSFLFRVENRSNLVTNKIQCPPLPCLQIKSPSSSSPSPPSFSHIVRPPPSSSHLHCPPPFNKPTSLPPSLRRTQSNCNIFSFVKERKMS